MFRLWVKKGSATGQVYEFDQDRITIGRTSHNTLQVKDPRISRTHLRIYYENNCFYLEDLKSTNGIKVNNKKLTQKKLDEGDEIKVGDTTLLFESGICEEEVEDVTEDTLICTTPISKGTLKEMVTPRDFGLINLQIKDDGLYIVITPEDFDKFALLDYENALQERAIEHYRHSALVKAYEEHDGFPICISAEEEETFEAEKYIDINISDGALRASATLYVPPSGSQVTVRDVIYKLTKCGVIYGIRRDVIRNLLLEKKTHNNVTIAIGKEAVQGKNATVEHKVNLEVSRKPVKLPNGSLDYKNIETVRCTQKGDILAVKHPPTPGTPGITVTGITINPSEGHDIRLPRGRNTVISQNGNKLAAAISGHVFLSQNQIHVENVLMVRGNVDYSTGNVLYTGDVIVRGDVLSGFKVETDGDIYIVGNVDGADLHTTMGNIKIEKGICGQRKAKIIADQGDIAAHYIQDATVIAGGSINAGTYLMSSDVTAGKNVTVIRGKGTLVGGVTRCREVLEARMLGTFTEQYTEVQIKSDDPETMNAQIQAMQNDEFELGKRIKQLRERITFILSLEKKLSVLSVSKRQELFELKEQLIPIEKKYNILIHKKEEILNRQKENDNTEKKMAVRVNGTVFPGVVVNIDNYELKLSKERRRVMMVYGDFGIKLAPL